MLVVSRSVQLQSLKSVFFFFKYGCKLYKTGAALTSATSEKYSSPIYFTNKKVQGLIQYVLDNKACSMTHKFVLDIITFFVCRYVAVFLP